MVVTKFSKAFVPSIFRLKGRSSSLKLYLNTILHSFISRKTTLIHLHYPIHSSSERCASLSLSLSHTHTWARTHARTSLLKDAFSSRIIMQNLKGSDDGVQRHKKNRFVEFAHRPKLHITTERRFEIRICFRLQEREGRHLICWVPGLNTVCLLPSLAEIDPVSETSFSSYLEFRTMVKVQKPGDSERRNHVNKVVLPLQLWMDRGTW
jgi:hypothetical protein